MASGSRIRQHSYRSSKWMALFSMHQSHLENLLKCRLPGLPSILNAMGVGENYRILT